MKIYVSIPISGHDIDKQKTKAIDIKRGLEKQGFEVVTPFEVAPEPNMPYSYYMGRDIEALLECDAIYMCEGHEQSKGCRLELTAALTYGKQIYNNKNLPI